MNSIEDLRVYQLAEKLSDLVWNEYDKWNSKVRFTIWGQIIRSADSISANLAEGYGRMTGPDKRRFYIISRGSFEETKTWINKLQRRGELRMEVEKEIPSIIDELGAKWNAFIYKTR